MPVASNKAKVTQAAACLPAQAAVAMVKGSAEEPSPAHRAELVAHRRTIHRHKARRLAENAPHLGALATQRKLRRSGALARFGHQSSRFTRRRTTRRQRFTAHCWPSLNGAEHRGRCNWKHFFTDLLEISSLCGLATDQP